MTITTAQDDVPGQQLTSTTYLDALGRVRYGIDGVGNKIQKAYRFGTDVSYELASNPYVATSDATMGWSLTTRDPVGRPKSVQSFAGSNPPAPWGTNASTTGLASTTYDVTTAGCARMLWGKNLSEHFETVYRVSGRYCVLFVSEHYVRKAWTRLERRSAIARALHEHAEYILPARFDSTEVPGILPTVGYVSLSGRTPADFAELLMKKLGRVSGPP